MKIYLKSKQKNTNATANYDEDTGEVVVLKGSIVSDEVSKSEKFRGAATVIKNRLKYVKDTVVQEDVFFKSASTAANFVNGNSTNGLIAWKTEDSKSLKAYLALKEQ